MKNLLKKITIYTLILFGIILIPIDKVKAKEQSVGIVTNNGDGYLIKADDISNADFYVKETAQATDLSKNIVTEIKKQGALNGDVTVGGKKYSYQDVTTRSNGYKSRILKINQYRTETGTECYQNQLYYNENGKETIGEVCTKYEAETVQVELLQCGEQRLVGTQPFSNSEIEKGVTWNKKTGTYYIEVEVTNNYLKKYFNNLIIDARQNGVKLQNIDRVTKTKNGEEKYYIVFYDIKPISAYTNNVANDPKITVTLTINTDDIYKPNKDYTKTVWRGLENDGGYLTDNDIARLVDGNSSAYSKFKNYCGNILYLTSFDITTDYAENLEVLNSHVDKSYCIDVKNYNNVSSIIREKAIPECYSSTIPYSENNDVESEIIRKFNVLKSMYDSIPTSTLLVDQENLLCTNNMLGIPSNTNDNTTLPIESKITYEEIGKYWMMTCKEEYYIESDDPKLVYSGQGISYDNRIEVQRTCKIININPVKIKPQCTSSVSVNCHYAACSYCDSSMRDVTWTNENTAGPTEDFDSCVSACDGGSYTQNCINQCYNEVYNSDRKLSYSNLSNYNFSNRVTKKNVASECSFNVTGNIGNENIGGSSCSDAGITVECTNDSCNGKPNCCKIFYNGSEGASVGVSDYCGGLAASSVSGAFITTNHGDGSVCDVTASQGPSGCVDNPESVYKTEMIASITEYNNMLDLAKQKSEVREYKIELTDGKDKVVYSVAGSSYDGTTAYDKAPRLNFEEDIELSKNKDNSKVTKEQVTIGDSGDVTDNNITIKATSNYASTIETTTVYNISLPTQYSKIGDANTIVVQGLGANNYFTYSTNSGTNDSDDIKDDVRRYGFNKFNDFNKNLFSSGENVYYTALDNKTDINVTLGVNCSSIPSNKTEREAYFLNYDKAFIFYEEPNGDTIFKQLNPENLNISVSFLVDAIGIENTYKYQMPAIGAAIELISRSGNTTQINLFEQSGYQCYYGVVNMLYESNTQEYITYCPDGGEGEPDPTPGPTTTTIPKTGLRYYYHEIDLAKLFEDRNPRWNWTGTINKKDGTTTGAASTDNGYIVDPEELIKSIKSKGDDIYNSDSNAVDYEFVMTPEIISQLRQYNKNGTGLIGSQYTHPKGDEITYLDFSLIADSKEPYNQSEVIRSLYSGLNTTSFTQCNNRVDGSATDCVTYNKGGK